MLIRTARTNKKGEVIYVDATDKRRRGALPYVRNARIKRRMPDYALRILTQARTPQNLF